jgi:hypothetical protein
MDETRVPGLRPLTEQELNTLVQDAVRFHRERHSNQPGGSSLPRYRFANALRADAPLDQGSSIHIQEDVILHKAMKVVAQDRGTRSDALRLASRFKIFASHREIVSIPNLLSLLWQFTLLEGKDIPFDCLTDNELAAFCMFGDEELRSLTRRLVQQKYTLSLREYIANTDTKLLLHDNVTAEDAVSRFLTCGNHQQIDLRGGGLLPLLEFLLWKPINTLAAFSLNDKSSITDYVAAQFLTYGSEQTRASAIALIRQKYYAFVAHRASELYYLSPAAAKEAVDHTFDRLEEYSRHHLLRMVNNSLGHFLSAICILKSRSAQRNEMRHAALLYEQLSATFIVDHVAGLEELGDYELDELSGALREALVGANLDENTMAVLAALSDLIISCSGLTLKTIETPTTEAIAALLELRGVSVSQNEIQSIRRNLRALVAKVLETCGYVFYSDNQLQPISKRRQLE